MKFSEELKKKKKKTKEEDDRGGSVTKMDDDDADDEVEHDLVKERSTSKSPILSCPACLTTLCLDCQRFPSLYTNTSCTDMIYEYQLYRHDICIPVVQT